MPIDTNNTLSFEGKYITGKKCGVHGFLNAPADTTVTTANTYYPIQGTFTNSPIEDFSLATDKIQYDGTKTQYFEVDWHATIKGDSASITAKLGVKKNDTVCTGSIIRSGLPGDGGYVAGVRKEVSTGPHFRRYLTPFLSPSPALFRHGSNCCSDSEPFRLRNRIR